MGESVGVGLPGLSRAIGAAQEPVPIVHWTQQAPEQPQGRLPHLDTRAHQLEAHCVRLAGLSSRTHHHGAATGRAGRGNLAGGEHPGAGDAGGLHSA